RALPVLGDHAFEAPLEARLEQFDPVLFYVVGDKEMPARFDRLRQSRAAPQNRLSQQGPAFQIERVKVQVRGRNLVAQPCASCEALSQTGIVRPAVGVSGDDLAVDDAPWRDALCRRGDLGQLDSEVVQATVF